MIKATYQQYILNFKQASGTSRGILRTKETYFLMLTKEGKKGIGECGLFRGLSADDRPDYEEKLAWVCDNIHLGLEQLLEELIEFPSIQFGLEQAFLSLEGNHPFELFPSKFSKGEKAISINGLIWMGDKSFMQKQIKDKLAQGFSTIKMKIGAIDFDTELNLLKSIRKEFSSDEIELRVDANGAFSAENALEKLKYLSELDMHSIEQPIKQGQWQEMASLCEKTPLAIALDEELIGVFSSEEKKKCIATIKPQYIILKPSLIGGFKGSNEWIEIASNHKAGNWITSALESNIGLNAIAQWTYTLNNPLPQGLGTGSLFTNNIESPLEVEKGSLKYNPHKDWKLSII
ncbi:o-succinylbenzoate synthase [uncultured Tenacibaculum sp.]|uniref:o-succinylbenzoate synthase n=1 Tax=uncultured Tenacibaculum sp. TaxID=174713 RepID=UPI002606A04E|nr:o-succinylbenzoate synthase [uncultured Tenacibaculum sp.]